MKTLPTARLAGIILIGCLLLAGGAVSAAGIQVYMGDIVTLQGYSTGSPTVYLFLTGPNLPVNGVALDNINARQMRGISLKLMSTAMITGYTVGPRTRWVAGSMVALIRSG